MALDIKAEEEAAKKAIANVSTRSARERLRADLDSLMARYETAVAAKLDTDLIAARVNQLRRDAETASEVSLWSWASIGLVVLVLLVYFGGIFTYMIGLGPGRYASIEATRPILVFTLIVAMLGFGGLLIVRALFSHDPDEEMEKRFRSAREIFLVFAGIFGTIIGFYFGAADEAGADPPSLTTPVYADGRVTTDIVGGRPPFIAFLEQDGRPTGPVIQGEGRALVFPAGDDCPDNASITVVDGQGRQIEAEVTCPETPTQPADENGDNATETADQPAGNVTAP